MAFEKGQGGRPKGATNLLTRTVKGTVLDVFNKLQEPDESNPDKMSLEKFAEKYPRDFYAIAAKLIPTEITAKVDATVKTFSFQLDARYDNTGNASIQKEL